jgi:hypothetical protein
MLKTEPVPVLLVCESGSHAARSTADATSPENRSNRIISASPESKGATGFSLSSGLKMKRPRTEVLTEFSRFRES